MKSPKIFLAAVSAIAAIGGAFALKGSKFNGGVILLDYDRDGVCETEKIGFKSTTYQTGYIFNYVTATVSELKACSRSYYLINP